MKNTHKHPGIIRRLIGNIETGRFNWENYLTPRSYYGVEICTIPLHCGYGQIGFTVYFPYSDLPQIRCDWELGRINVPGDGSTYFTKF